MNRLWGRRLPPSAQTDRERAGGMQMSEKAYKTMTNTGAGSLALGIILLVTGLAAGILMVINGARLLKSRSELIF